MLSKTDQMKKSNERRLHMEMKDEFLFKTHMLDKNGEKTGVDQIADYMFRADMIYRMKLASDMGLPVLTLIARELEEKFDENSSFPVTATKNDPNALSRQNVGRIAKFIMDKLGYVPAAGSVRLPAVSKSRYFSTSAVYEKKKKGKQKMYAAYNIALGYEMQDSIHTAEEWALKAEKIAYDVDKIDEKKTQERVDLMDVPNYFAVTRYLNELQERKKGMTRLNAQMERFKNDF